MDVLLSYTLQTNLLHNTKAEFEKCDGFKPMFDFSQTSIASYSTLKALFFLVCARKNLLNHIQLKRELLVVTNTLCRQLIDNSVHWNEVFLALDSSSQINLFKPKFSCKMYTKYFHICIRVQMMYLSTVFLRMNKRPGACLLMV